MQQTGMITTSPEASVADPDPHQRDKLDPDPYQSDKTDPDPYLDPHEFADEKPKCLEYEPNLSTFSRF
jgi:hypothetical protein